MASSNRARVNRLLNPSPHISNNTLSTSTTPPSRPSYSGATPTSFFPRQSQPQHQEMPPVQMIDAEEFRDFAVNISVAITAMQDQINELVSQHIETRKSCQEIQDTLEVMKKDVADHQVESSMKLSHSKKSDPDLCASIRRAHRSFDVDKQYNSDEKVGSKHNIGVTDLIVKSVLSEKKYTDPDAISYAAKKHHEYLVKISKELPEDTIQEKRQINRLRARRRRRYATRMKNATEKEKKILKMIDDKFMSDEETDAESSTLIIRRLPWRSEKLTKLLSHIDNRMAAKKGIKPLMKVRRYGQDSERRPPSKHPSWAVTPLVNECNMTDEAGSTNAEISPDSESGSGSSSVSQRCTSESEESAEEESINDCNRLDDDLDQWLEEFAS